MPSRAMILRLSSCLPRSFGNCGEVPRRSAKILRRPVGVGRLAARNGGDREGKRGDAAAWHFSQGAPRIELLEAATPHSVIGRFVEKRGEGLHHVALRVPDLAAAVERLRASGSQILNEPREGAGGHLYVFVHPSSTGGVLLELIQA